ncbi:MAG TPA: Wzz/FepE/Etk N-terminal domain-containing protein [Bacteroidota bacterium]
MEDFQPGKESESGAKPDASSQMVVKPVGEIVLDFLSVLTRYRRFIVWFVFVVSVSAAVVAAVSEKWYRSTALVFPAEQTSLFPGLESLSSVARTLGVGGRLGSLGKNTDLDRYMAILNSESVLLRVIEKFDLINVYEITQYPREKTMKSLLANSEFDFTDEGGLGISVYDTDPQRAADMANYFVEVLNETNSRMMAQNARANREFIEKRVQQGKADLREAEDTMRAFQEDVGMIIAPDAGSSGISAVAEMYLMKAKKEIEIGILGRSVGSDNPMLSQMELELSEINKKVDQLPEVGVGSLRLYRDVYIQQKIMEFLIPMYEQAKVEEQRATPSVIVLDMATPAERKAKPKIALYGLMGFVISSMLALFVVFTLEGINRLRVLQPERFAGIVGTLRSDWLGFRLKRKP